MPRISEFFGIAIYMYYKDHSPPHFHAIYAQYDAAVGIDPVEVLEGILPRRVQSLVNGQPCIRTSCRPIGNRRERVYRCSVSPRSSENRRMNDDFAYL